MVCVFSSLTQVAEHGGNSLLRSLSACGGDLQPRHTHTVTPGNWEYHRGADKSLARPGRKQVNVSVRMT